MLAEVERATLSVDSTIPWARVLTGEMELSTSKLASKQASMQSSLSALDHGCSRTSCPCTDFPTVMDCNLEYLSLLRFFLSEYFIRATETKLKQHGS